MTSEKASLDKPSTTAFIVANADQCVKCGLCLPHCPSYRLLRNEAESPRGRIALMQGLAQGQLQIDKPLLQHLDRCLGCQACEKVCPSGVQYGQLLDRSRDLIEQDKQRPWRTRLIRRTLLYICSHAAIWSRSWRLLRLYQRSGLQTLLRHSGLLRLMGLRRLDAELPRIHAPQRLASHYPATGQQRGHVALFNGCMEDIISATLRQDTIRLLNHAGFEVIIPPDQGCCGALHQHNGDLASARAMARNNINAFTQTGVDTALYLSSGCGVTLSDYSTLFGEAAQKEGPRFVEAIQFLHNSNTLQPSDFNPLRNPVAWLSPCSQRNITKGQSAFRQLLNLIPALDVIKLDNDCCGAAGSYMLSQPELATALRDEVLAPFKDNGIRTLVTANVGCTLHLTNGLRQQGLDVEVIHPLTLLARQLKKGLRLKAGLRT